MIQKILDTLCTELNYFLRRRYESVEDKVMLSPLVDDAGKAILGSNKILCTWINTQQFALPPSPQAKGKIVRNSPLGLELHLQFTASYANHNYAEALAILTSTMGFFQRKSVFNPQNTPGLPSAFDKVSMELLDLDPTTLSQLWLAQKVPLQPALHYRCRLELATEEMLLQEVPAIQGIPQLEKGDS